MFIVILCVLLLFLCFLSYVFFFFFKQKTAYEMRISDWSSDVCSSDLATQDAYESVEGLSGSRFNDVLSGSNVTAAERAPFDPDPAIGGSEGYREIGRASCRERVCQYV